MKRSCGFTLLEMLLATVLASLLMGGVLLMTAAIGRDRARLAADDSASRPARLLEQVRWDLTNATTMAQFETGRGLVLVGHGGIDPVTLLPTGRLTRVIYEIRGRGADAALFRRQIYLDESAQPQPWTELVAVGVTTLYVVPRSADFEPVEKEKPLKPGAGDDEVLPPELLKYQERRGPKPYFVPSRVKLQLQRIGRAYEEEMWLR